MVARPRLKQQFRPLRRAAAGALQLGLDRRRGRRPRGLGEAEIALARAARRQPRRAAAAAVAVSTAYRARSGSPASSGTLRAHAICCSTAPTDRL